MLVVPRRQCGKATGPTREGRARIMSVGELPAVRDAIRRRFRVLDGTFSLVNRQQGGGEEVALEIRPPKPDPSHRGRVFTGSSQFRHTAAAGPP